MSFIRQGVFIKVMGGILDIRPEISEFDGFSLYSANFLNEGSLAVLCKWVLG